MPHFAKIENGIVTQVMVVDWETLNQEGHPWGDPASFVQTSYNTHGGQHPEGRPLHKNYAGISYTWDGIGFAPPQPFPSWTKNPDTYLSPPQKLRWNFLHLGRYWLCASTAFPKLDKES